jgi:hypothetical protein
MHTITGVLQEIQNPPRKFSGETITSGLGLQKYPTPSNDYAGLQSDPGDHQAPDDLPDDPVRFCKIRVP